MEFERSLFRVYDRCMESVNPIPSVESSYTPKFLNMIYYAFMFLSCTFLVVTTTFHWTFANSMCTVNYLSSVLSSKEIYVNSSSDSVLPGDMIYNLKVEVNGFNMSWTYSGVPALPFVPSSYYDKHLINVVNATLPSECFGTNNFVQFWMSSLMDYEIVIVNELFRMNHYDGILISRHIEGTTYSWSKDDQRPSDDAITKLIYMIPVSQSKLPCLFQLLFMYRRNLSLFLSSMYFCLWSPVWSSVHSLHLV